MVKSHQSVNWQNYFTHIKSQCPWSYQAYQQGQIDIVPWTGQIHPLAHYQARIYLVDLPNDQLEQLAKDLDHGEDEWLFSYPQYGEWATPVSVLIQQNRARLRELRHKLGQD